MYLGLVGIFCPTFQRNNAFGTSVTVPGVEAVGAQGTLIAKDPIVEFGVQRDGSTAMLPYVVRCDLSKTIR